MIRRVRSTRSSMRRICVEGTNDAWKLDPYLDGTWPGVEKDGVTAHFVRERRSTAFEIRLIVNALINGG
jgi:hypothetical protein